MSTETTPQSEDDIQAAQAPLVVRMGGGFVLAAGVLAILVAVQTLSGFWVSARFTVALVVIAALGVVTGVSGLMIMRARAWAAFAGLAGSALLCLATAGWLVASLGSGLVSLFALGAPMASVIAAAFAAGSIAPCRRVSAARARLVAQGLDMGL